LKIRFARRAISFFVRKSASPIGQFHFSFENPLRPPGNFIFRSKIRFARRAISFFVRKLVSPAGQFHFSLENSFRPCGGRL
jgi:hypothetical protein